MENKYLKRNRYAVSQIRSVFLITMILIGVFPFTSSIQEDLIFPEEGLDKSIKLNDIINTTETNYFYQNSEGIVRFSNENP